MSAKKYALIRISTGACVYGKRNVCLPGALPIPGLDPDLKWYEMQFSAYPVINEAIEGITYTETLEGDFFKVTYEKYLISDGRKKPITIQRGN